MDKARETAMKILHEVHENGAYANVALVQQLRQARLSEIDRRFVTELVYGAVKAGDTLDWMLRRYVNRPLSRSRLWCGIFCAWDYIRFFSWIRYLPRQPAMSQLSLPSAMVMRER